MEQQGYRRPPGPERGAFLDGDGGGKGEERDLPAVDHADWRRELRGTVLSRVVPRLSEMGRPCRKREGAPAARPAWPSKPAAPSSSGGAPTEAQVAAFSDMVLASAVPGLVEHVDALRAQGLPIEAVVLGLLAPSARRLGDLWLRDELSFLDVTAGLGRLQGVMRALGADFDGDGPGRIHGRKVLLAPASGEQHVFGLSVVAAFFRRAGWDVTFEPSIAFDDLLTLVRAERFAAIGLSVANDRLLAALPGQIEALRRASLNPDAALLAGGPAFLLDPELEGRVGVDAVARDGAEAVRMAEALSGRVSDQVPVRAPDRTAAARAV